jgi:hypothetical protein
MSSSPQQTAIMRKEASGIIHALAGAAPGITDAAKLKAQLAEVAVLQDGLGESASPSTVRPSAAAAAAPDTHRLLAPLSAPSPAPTTPQPAPAARARSAHTRR